MAKKVKAEEATNTEATAPVEAAKEKEVKPEKVYFLGPKWCTQISVFGHIKAVIAENQNLAEGRGVPVNVIVKEMLEKYQPKKSGNYGEKYIRAYVRDLEKFGYATTDPSQAVAELTVPPEKEKKEAKKTSKISETGQKILSKMAEIVSEEDYRSGNSVVTAETIQKELEMKPVAAGKAVESLVKNGYLNLKEEGDTISLLFTEQGWGHVHQRLAAE